MDTTLPEPLLRAVAERRLVVLAEYGETLLGLLCLDSKRTHFCGGAEEHLPGGAPP